MEDWVTWPVFFIELIIFIVLLVKPSAKCFGFSMRTWAITLIVVTGVYILLSLNHDSTSHLSLYY